MRKLLDHHAHRLSARLAAPLLTLLLAASAAAAADTPKPTKLFKNGDTLPVTISAPWQDLIRNDEYQGAYPATLDYTDESGAPVKLDLTVERRGLTRQRVCRYPPIRLRFEKEAVKGTTFRGQKSLKMVTHCERASRFEQYYVLEMLAYRIYNQITDYSFRIRPLDIDYHDSERGKTDEDRFGFLIEDDSDVAKRHDLKKLRIPKLRSTMLEPALSSEFALFQYLISNVDWAALSGPDPNECCHNVKLIGKKELEAGDRVYPIPYDFDSSGLVNADYAVPPQGLPINSVTQRLYRGYCSHSATLEDARRKIVALEGDILALVENEPRLTSGSRRKALRFLDRGFATLKDPEDFSEKITAKCRK
ncbi:MAG: hypothetical protein KJN94_05300 [Gammaproteobacteria bacterium]|nr:hypothetical protein [Gammaproteobacteria bacterium]